MAYAQGRTRSERLASAGMAVALHIGVGAAILATFAGGVITEVIHTVPQVFNVPPEPVPPPPQPQMTQKPADSVVIVPKSEFTLAPLDPDVLVIKPALNDRVDVIVPTGPTGIATDPVPTPTASFVPRAARPKTSPATWATALDYPPRALREGRSGITAFRVSIGTDGKVTDCMVIRSSGSQDLDTATCAKVSKRAKFEPATDDAGNPVAGSYANSIRWEIPQ